MGTKHKQIVITKEGERKVSQYGQWDGYPDGQGIEILKFLKEADLDKYQEEVAKLREITDEEGDMVNKTENWQNEYPYLSRDCGSDIHQLILDGEVKFLSLMGEDDNSWIEGFYTIDFQKGIFISEYHDEKAIFKLDELPTKNQYLRAMGDDEIELDENEEEIKKTALAKLTNEEKRVLGIQE
jgi:hypothetical protein